MKIKGNSYNYRRIILTGEGGMKSMRINPYYIQLW
jgi:hypothetical protein